MTERQSDRVNNFDLIRLFGALQVAVSHSIVHLKADALLPLYYFLGYLPGVPIFFAISGFLVSLSWERAPSWQQYAINRALRIYPALWAAFVLAVVILLACHIYPGSPGEFARWLAAQLSFMQFYNPPFIRGFGVGVINGSAWTIPVEMQFYVALPFLAFVARKSWRRWAALIVLSGLLMLAVRLIDARSIVGKLVTVTLLPWLFYFLMGVGLRYLYRARPGIFRGKALDWAGIYALWVAIEIVFHIPGATENVLNPVSIVLLGCLTVSAAFTLPSLATRLLRENDISYGVYIYHMPFVNLILFLGLLGVFGLVAALSLAVTMAILSWRFIERPALNLKGYSVHWRTRSGVARHSWSHWIRP